MKITKLATSGTKEGIEQMINRFWYSSNFTVNFETGQINGFKKPIDGFKVVKSKGRYIFINEQ